MHRAAIALLIAASTNAPALRAAEQPAAAPIQFLNSGKVLATNLPFSEAVRVGETVYLSGQIGVLALESR